MHWLSSRSSTATLSVPSDQTTTDLSARRTVLRAVVIATLSFLLLYIAASIFLGVPLSGLLTVIGLVFVLVALRTRKRALGIIALVIVGVVAAVLVWAGLELITSGR